MSYQQDQINAIKQTIWDNTENPQPMSGNDIPDAINALASEMYNRGLAESGSGIDNGIISTFPSQIIGLNEIVPEDAIPSVCDFRLIPKTTNAAMSLYDDGSEYFHDFNPGGNVATNGLLNGLEIPLVTTRGTLIVRNSAHEITCKKNIPELINYSQIYDELYNDRIIKRWSERFYINRPPDEVGSDEATFSWKFKKNEFENYGLPKKETEIPFISPFFCCTDSDIVEETTMSDKQLPVAAYFSYHEGETESYYELKCRVRYYHENYGKRFCEWTPSYICYPLAEEVVSYDNMISCYLEKGYSVEFQQDECFFTENPTEENMCDSFNEFWENYARKRKSPPFFDKYNTMIWARDNNAASREDKNNINSTTMDSFTIPTIEITIPKCIVNSLQGMEQIVKDLSSGKSVDSTSELSDYRWIGDADKNIDYTEIIQRKLDEVHNTTNGGNVFLGNGTYKISNSLIVYSNTRIIGTGYSTIEQTSDNTHGIIMNGDYIHLQDLTIKLSGACTELTGCIFANSNNHVNSNKYDANYPSNHHVYYGSAKNIKLIGKYEMGVDTENNPYIPEGMLDYRGVGIYSRPMYFCFFDGDNILTSNLYAGIYNGGNSCNYKLFSMNSRIAAYIRGGLNTYDIHGHTYYSGTLSMTDYVVYCNSAERNIISVGFYDTQHTISDIYFDGLSFSNSYMIAPSAVGQFNSPITGSSIISRESHSNVIDYGRCNVEVLQPKHIPYAVGSRIFTASGLSQNNELHGAMENALAGAGVWGNITSTTGWKEQGISLSQVCRYPEQKITQLNRINSVVSNVSPSEETPLEITIDISNRPIITTEVFWIQFDYRYIAEDFTIYLDTTNDGTFDQSLQIVDNNQTVWYRANHQKSVRNVYRIKLSFTKALRIENLEYQDGSYNTYTVDYNPNCLVGLANIGMASSEPFGRAFLGECGGNVYGNIDMHENILTNIGAPQGDKDAVNKAYVDKAVANSGGTGEPGYTPVKGVDYWTEVDKAEIKSYVDEAILGGAW